VSTRTDASGAFELGCEIEEGELWIVAEAKGWTKAEIGPLSPSEAAHGEHSLDLTHGGTIEGRVRTASGESGEGAIIGLNHGDARPRTLRAGPNGAFRVEGLAPGPWQVLLREREVSTTGITIMDNGERRDIAWTCEVAAGATTRVELEMPER
jgi:hypothetical protein